MSKPTKELYPTGDFTPGPWRMEPILDHNLASCPGVYDSDGMKIVDLGPHIWNLAPKNVQREMAANARLISCAPDLLAFAKREREDVHEESCDSSSSHSPRCEALMDLIKKATGRA